MPVQALASTPTRAPESIMPSMPMLSTPALSEIRTPKAASSSGVMTRSTVAKRAGSVRLFQMASIMLPAPHP